MMSECINKNTHNMQIKAFVLREMKQKFWKLKFLLSIMFLVDDKLFCNFLFCLLHLWRHLLAHGNSLWHDGIIWSRQCTQTVFHPRHRHRLMLLCRLSVTWWIEAKANTKSHATKEKNEEVQKKKRKRSWEMSCLASLAVPTSCWSDGNNKWWNPTLQMTQSSLCPVHTSALANGESGTEINVDVSSWWFDPSKPNSRRFILSIHP